jgi:hypothetical protein
MNISLKETATLLAALRHWQALLGNTTEPDRTHITQSFDHFTDSEPMTVHEIDQLCEKINGTTEPDDDPVDDCPIQELVNTVVEDKKADGRIFSGNKRQVQINLVGLTRMEYGEAVMVPSEFGADDITRLADSAYDDVDGSYFTEDVEYWEKGECSFDLIMDKQ